MSEARAFVFRERAFQAYKKAMRPGIPEEIRRSWLIIERDWTRMAEREAFTVNGAVSPHPQRDGSAGWRELEAEVCGRQEQARLAIKKLSIDEWWPEPA
jgi:hypothetical protein